MRVHVPECWYALAVLTNLQLAPCAQQSEAAAAAAGTSPASIIAIYHSQSLSAAPCAAVLCMPCSVHPLQTKEDASLALEQHI
jgi:hypothetical protein